MRKFAAALFVILVFSSTRAAYATDCNAAAGSTGWFWQDYSPETLTEQKSTWDCWTLDNLSPTTLSYFSIPTPGFEIRGLSGSATRTFTVPAAATGHIEVQMLAELTDPHSSWYNQILARVVVRHPGTYTATFYELYTHNGTQGYDLANPHVDIYNVAEGDTITIYIQGGWSFDDDSHARFSDVHLYHLDF